MTPAYHKSTFNQTGEITPEEFVEAGDYLAYKFPTWSWSPAPASKRRAFLPDDKQFLVTRKVPSYVRALEYLDVDLEEEVDENGWTQTSKPKYTKSGQKPEDHSAEIEEIDDMIDEGAEDFDDADSDTNDTTTNEANLNKRSYDLYIHYSTTYRVPRVYLIGYENNGSPLTPDEMFQDISTDYREKTVTIEKAPFLEDTTTISIHPCRHAEVMKVLINRATLAKEKKLKKEKDNALTEEVKKLGLADNEDEWEHLEVNGPNESNEDVVRVDQYLIIFLKFITSVTPGIEHDYTMDAF